jgi:hypothetical protein
MKTDFNTQHFHALRRTIMKRICKGLCSVLFATSVALPANTLATPLDDFEDVAEERVAQPAASDSYKLAFLTGDFGLHFSGMGTIYQPGTMVMFLSGPDGKIVKNAQVVTTIIDQNGAQQMQRAQPLKGGYLVDTTYLPQGQ